MTVIGGFNGAYFVEVNGSPQTISPITFREYVGQYCQGYRLEGGSNFMYSLQSNPKVNKTASLLVHLYSQARSGASASDLAYNNYEDIMSALKSASVVGFVGHRRMLGADGYFYHATNVESHIDIKGIATTPAG